MPAKLIDINGPAIRAARYASGLSVQELAANVKASRNHISNIEHGRKGASPRLLKQIAAALGVDANTLVTASPRVAA